MIPEPEIVRLPEQFFTGLQARFVSSLSPEANNMAVIPQLWGDFCAREAEIATSETGVTYGLCACPSTLGETPSRPDEAIYLAAVKVARPGPAPAGMTTWTSRGGAHAKFVHRGPIGGIGETMAHIYGEWLPNSAYEHADAPDIERYGPKFDPESEASELEIFIPVREKNASAA
jgi:AraC family transcriptional regulator